MLRVPEISEADFKKDRDKLRLIFESLEALDGRRN
jgi:hypothetical protein